MDFQLVMDGKMLLGLATTMLNSFLGYTMSQWGGYTLSSNKIPKFGCGRVLRVGYGQPPNSFHSIIRVKRRDGPFLGVLILLECTSFFVSTIQGGKF